MHIKLIMQKDEENTLAEEIKASFDRKPKKAYFLCGNFKENGFRIIEDEIIGTNVKLLFAIGIDKKHTTKNMLESLLKCTKEIYVYSNNGQIEFNSSVFIFEYDKEAVMYVSASNVSEGGLNDDLSLYTKIIFNTNIKEEKDDYKKHVKYLLEQVESEEFIKLTKDLIEKLITDNEIFSTKQYNHSVKSISELLGNNREDRSEKKEITKQEVDDIFVSDINIPKVDLSDISIEFDDIDFTEIEDRPVITKKEESINIDIDDIKEKEYDLDTQIEENDETEYKLEDLDDTEFDNIEFDSNDSIDINELLFSKADIKLDKPQKTEKIGEEPVAENEESVQQGKKINLNNVSNYIFELPDRPLKEQDRESIKIPNYIRTLIPDFFELNNNCKNVEKDGSKFKIKDINLEIVDVKNSNKFSDREASIIYKSGQTYFSINSEMLKNVEYSEHDISRLIKLSTDTFHVEIIAKDLQEYKLWSKVCNQQFKSSTKKYGMM